MALNEGEELDYSSIPEEGSPLLWSDSTGKDRRQIR
jgi:hypothetical protein